MSLDLDASSRALLWDGLKEAVERYILTVKDSPVSPSLQPDALREWLSHYNFKETLKPEDALHVALEGMFNHQVHASHPRYFGLFHPPPSFAGIIADALVAAFNPQLAAWSQSPFAVEVEQHLVRAFAERFGFPENSEGTFTAGGAEANHTALLVALAGAYPEFTTQGLRALPGQPTVYVSRDSHHSLRKAARLVGLGSNAVEQVPVDKHLRMDVGSLAEMVRRDRATGKCPFLVVATAGTTSAGAVDPLSELADLCEREGLWLHVDAAWGGAAALAQELRPILNGIQRADSLTFDAHKWLSVPMAAGLFLTRHDGLAERTFAITTGYMPNAANELDVTDPYANSIQWSRRFIGLKVFLSLLIAGWEGYAKIVRDHVALGRYLKEALVKDGWEMVNSTALPVLCFVDTTSPLGRDAGFLKRIVNELVTSGEAWISLVHLGDQAALRACVTNHRTRTSDADALVRLLSDLRARQIAADAVAVTKLKVANARS